MGNSFVHSLKYVCAIGAFRQYGLHSEKKPSFDGCFFRYLHGLYFWMEETEQSSQSSQSRKGTAGSVCQTSTNISAQSGLNGMPKQFRTLLCANSNLVPAAMYAKKQQPRVFCHVLRESVLPCFTSICGYICRMKFGKVLAVLRVLQPFTAAHAPLRAPASQGFVECHQI